MTVSCRRSAGGCSPDLGSAGGLSTVAGAVTVRGLAASF
jgi:hypothetical protein